jgi:CheY-like chemotaxis protein
MAALDSAEAKGIPRLPVVLVVDDNELARTLLAFIVRGHGYDVRSAASGREAVEVCSKETVDLVILDVVMPELDGPKSFEILKSHNPDIRCCFATGGTRDYSDHDLAQRGGAWTFKKPFSAPEIGQVLRQLFKNKSCAAS